MPSISASGPDTTRRSWRGWSAAPAGSPRSSSIRHWPSAPERRNISVVHGDGTRIGFEPADVILVNAGATRPADIWLDRLKDGGRLILPLTGGRFPDADMQRGAVFRIIRHGDEYAAERISAVAIFPCEGMRDDASEAALNAAFETGRVRQVRRLYRRDDVPEADCWVRGPGWCLAYR